jgi:hypothetical protein
LFLLVAAGQALGVGDNRRQEHQRHHLHHPGHPGGYGAVHRGQQHCCSGATAALLQELQHLQHNGAGSARAETWRSGLICHGGDAGKAAAASGEAFHPNSDEKEAFA